MAQPQFSVIIAVFNGEKTLARAIESVLIQSYTALEIIVVDDGSIDATATVAQSFGESVSYHYQPNAGVAAARNQGASLAQGDWLAFLDADDWYYPDRLKWHAQWIEEDRQLDFLTGDQDYVAPDGLVLGRSMDKTEAGKALLKPLQSGHRAMMQGEVIGQFVEKHFGDTHTLSVPRATFQRLEGYPVGVAVCEDVNFLIRLCAVSQRIGVICQPMAAYVVHDAGATRSNPLRAQYQTLAALLPLRETLADTNQVIRRGLTGCIRTARLDLAVVLLKQKRRLAALSHVVPLLMERPGWQSIRDCLSVIRGSWQRNYTVSNGVLVLTELFLPTKGGTAVWFDEVYRRLGGREVHIITADVPGSQAYDVSHKNSIYRITMRRYWWLKPESLAMYLKMFAKAMSIVLRKPVQTIHAGRVLPEGLVGSVVAKIFRKPLVIYAHGEEITTWRQSSKFKAMVWTYKQANYVIANSDFTRDELIKIGIDTNKILRISPGVDIERFRPGLAYDDLLDTHGIKSSQRIILSVGRLSRRKGFDQVVNALPSLVGQGIDVQYVLIGIGEDRQYLTTLATELGVEDRVHLIGHVSMDDLPRWYNAATLFAMPNRDINGDTEGFGMVFLEAAACKKPAVAGLAGGTGAAVLHGETGYRVDGADLDAISAGIMDFLQHDDKLQYLGEAAYQRALRDFSWASIAEQTKITLQL